MFVCEYLLQQKQGIKIYSIYIAPILMYTITIFTQPPRILRCEQKGDVCLA